MRPRACSAGVTANSAVIRPPPGRTTFLVGSCGPGSACGAGSGPAHEARTASASAAESAWVRIGGILQETVARVGSAIAHTDSQYLNKLCNANRIAASSSRSWSSKPAWTGRSYRGFRTERRVGRGFRSVAASSSRSSPCRSLSQACARGQRLDGRPSLAFEGDLLVPATGRAPADNSYGPIRLHPPSGWMLTWPPATTTPAQRPRRQSRKGGRAPWKAIGPPRSAVMPGSTRRIKG